MKVLQLCCFTNLWPSTVHVESIDLRLGKNIFDLPFDYGRSFDLVVSAPPCEQFTKANNTNWAALPEKYISIAKKCFELSINSGRDWILENPPRRITSFLPELIPYRRITWNCSNFNKEYVLYSNMLLLNNYHKRYNGSASVKNLTKKQREAWLPELVEYFYYLKSF